MECYFLSLPDVINKFLNIDYRLEITSVREYSDRSESIKLIKILDEYDIRNFDSYFTCTVSNNGSVCSFTERKLFKAFKFKPPF